MLHPLAKIMSKRRIQKLESIFTFKEALTFCKIQQILYNEKKNKSDRDMLKIHSYYNYMVLLNKILLDKVETRTGNSTRDKDTELLYHLDQLVLNYLTYFNYKFEYKESKHVDTWREIR